MNSHVLLEAAVRSVVMGAIIFVALRLLRIEQVRAVRTAWLLALAGALAMPLLVAAQIGPRLLPEISFTHQPSVEALTVAPGGDGSDALPAPQFDPVPAHGMQMSAAQVGAARDVPRATSSSIDDGSGARMVDIALTVALIGYGAVAAILALRLCVGVGFALRLKNRAERVVFAFDPELDTRASARLATPVTIGSSILLPRNYTLWDGPTLRIVLSHERAHVRQKDFYVHALAGLHCALFWFNPFSWWLQRQLSELGEALSDCAAVEQAESRASYAETLLAFATRERWPVTGVGMAGNSNLTPRIERLLSDQGFERSFAPKRRLPFIAAGVVLLAMAAATSMVRVHAATSSGPLNANSVATNTFTSASPASDVPPAPITPPAPIAPPVPITPPSPPAAETIAGPQPERTPASQQTKKKTHRVKQDVVDIEVNDVDVTDTVSDDVAAEARDRAEEEAERAAEQAERVSREAGRRAAREAERVVHEADRAAREADRASREAEREAERIAHESDRSARNAGHHGQDGEDVLAIRSGESHMMFNAGNMLSAHTPESGDYIYFQHNGKPYLIQDPQIIAKAQALLAPMKEIGEKQRQLGHEQAMLGTQQHTLATERQTMKMVDSPQFKHDMEELQKRLKDIDLPRLTAQIDQRALAEVQSHLGEIQARVGRLQSEFGVQGHQFGEEMSKLGQEQSRLGERQHLLGEQQRKILEETKRQLKPIIEQAIREGKGKVLTVE